MHKILSALCAAAAVAVVPPGVEARNIVLTNDDGLTSNVVSLYRALKEAGHDVVVAVPCTNQSGQGAALDIGEPLMPLSESCLNDAASPGDPGAGPMTRAGLPADDFFYVAGTPVMSLMYGLDVVGMERWGAAPDLVLSGPNEGQNVGAIVISSGTVSNAQFAALRGLPAIALSAGSNTKGEALDNPLSADIALLSVALVEALQADTGEGPLLPEGLALNVNFPDDLAGAGWRVARIGSYNAYEIGFTANMAENASPTMQAMAQARNVALPPLPGISFGINQRAPAVGQEKDESIVYRRHITVSPMQAGYEFGSPGEDFLRWQLSGLLEPEPAAAR